MQRAIDFLRKLTGLVGLVRLIGLVGLKGPDLLQPALAAGGGDDFDADPYAQMALADAADASLLRLVLCAAGATLLLALASSLI
jgi:hypothetical protein